MGRRCNRCGITFHIHIGRITYIISVSFEKTDHGIFCIEKPVFHGTAAAAAIAGNKGTIITTLGSMTCRIAGRAYIQTIATIGIIGLPGCIGGFK